MGIHQGFILDSPGVVGVVYSIPRSSIELDISTPMSFDQFLALMKFQQLSTFVISTTLTFSLFINFALVLWTKFLNNTNKKITHKTFTKNLLLFSSSFYADCLFIQIVKKHLQKYFVLYLRMCSFMFKLFKKNTKYKHTSTCCAFKEHCCAVSTYMYCIYSIYIHITPIYIHIQ